MQKFVLLCRIDYRRPNTENSGRSPSIETEPRNIQEEITRHQMPSKRQEMNINIINTPLQLASSQRSVKNPYVRSVQQVCNYLNAAYCRVRNLPYASHRSLMLTHVHKTGQLINPSLVAIFKYNAL